MKNSDIDVNYLEQKMIINNPEISWIAINIIGTNATVTISPNTSLYIEENDITASNLKASVDGVITRMEVKNGTAMVQVGDGVTSDQLLVSGVIDYNTGTSVLTDSNAQIYALVSRQAQITVPLELETAEKSTECVTKTDMSVLGVTIPLSLNSNPDESCIKSSTTSDVSFFEKTVPIKIISEKWYDYSINIKRLSSSEAKKIAENRISLYEVFLLYSLNKAEFISKSYSITEYSDKIVLSAEYEVEEDICVKSIIQTTQ